ncbi:hypothetical protein QFZ40_003191 [Arthrobacter pascens]|nr:hypothetical protein [Arthrobacter pascens]
MGAFPVFDLAISTLNIVSFYGIMPCQSFLDRAPSADIIK